MSGQVRADRRERARRGSVDAGRPKSADAPRRTAKGERPGSQRRPAIRGEQRGVLRPRKVRLHQGPGLVQAPTLAPVRTSGLNCSPGDRRPSQEGYGEPGITARSLINVLWAARWVEIARRSCPVVHGSLRNSAGFFLARKIKKRRNLVSPTYPHPELAHLFALCPSCYHRRKTCTKAVRRYFALGERQKYHRPRVLPRVIPTYLRSEFAYPGSSLCH
jgi:hypothetical protein